MRVKLFLSTDQKVARNDFELKYRSAFNGFIYNLLSKSNFSRFNNFHDTKTPKLFSFSGVKGIFDKNGDLIPTKEKNYVIVLSTANETLFLSTIMGIKEYFQNNLPINLGPAQFYIEKLKTEYLEINKNDIFISDNIISLMDKAGKFVFYGSKNWKHLLINNCEKKAKQLQIENTKIGSIFDKLNFERVGTFAIPYLVDNKKISTVGDKIKIKIVNSLNDNERKTLTKLFDAGLGIRNSYGYGFISKLKVI